jgi:NAD+ diphosphatase
VLPGGGIERGEAPVQTAVREAKEESGVNIVHPVYVGQKSYTNQYKRVIVFYFTAEADDTELVIDGQEIIDAGWFTIGALPPDTTIRLQEEVILYTNWKHEKN